ncbi:phosphoethanolamine transferase [Cesiribacter sp. SM1]|uniref:phosphoethanolamine transferase n=1 Tax=Cesiribacter sp. SM1 TaxID=2861196 RepID=UPI001CD20D87|nr:phosphoethanolamine transferase [Cesiribacter sp. SM1]
MAGLFFLIPVFLFFRNIKAYLYLLLPIVLLSPLFIFSIVLFELRPRFELIALIMQTNLQEISEVVSGHLSLFIPVSLAYTLLYLYCVKRLAVRKLPFRTALYISLMAAVFCIGRIGYEKKLYKAARGSIGIQNLLAVKYYPASVFGGALEAYTTLVNNKMRIAEDFSFQAFEKDSLSHRKVYVLIIGESSRYDKWQINGYRRATSPRLATQENLISYSNVISGSSQTRMSVPMMITRATPDSIEIQYREKSILAAFSEAGYKTLWLSNQTDQEIFWSGSINQHANAADISIFSPSFSPNFEIDHYYDERLLPALDTLIQKTDDNLFIVLHTIGNHWDYSKRYPASFDYFTPSGKTVNIGKPCLKNRQAVINSYDNSILYADFFIDSVINTIKKHDVVSAVKFLSDHGEDLFDTHASRIDFHLSESPQTLHVPLFIWTSHKFTQHYPQKHKALIENKDKKVGAENTFYTLLDLANIGIKQDDSTRSLASCSFIEREQKYLSNTDRMPLLYSRLSENSKCRQ